MTTDPTRDAIEAAALAQQFHEAYERLAPSFSYQTREASAKPWAEVPENNRALMTAVCAELLPMLRHAIAEQAVAALTDLRDVFSVSESAFDQAQADALDWAIDKIREIGDAS